jgi:Flp pilus assembly protein TadD
MAPTVPVTSFGFAAKAAALAAARGRHADARRHLRAAAKLDPADAATRFRLAQAYEQDPFGSDELAAKHYWAAAKHDRTNAEYRVAYGRAAVRAGNAVAGVKALVRAAKLAPADTTILAVVVDGLLAAGRVCTARRVIGRARFLRRNDATLTGLWARVRFAEALAEQETLRPATVLPFVRVVAKRSPTADGRIVRADLPSPRPRPHIGRTTARKSRG